MQSDWCVLPVQSQQWFFQQHVQEISNVTIGAILWLVLAVGQLSFVHRLLAATRSGKRWCVAVMNALTSALLPDPCLTLLQQSSPIYPSTCELISSAVCRSLRRLRVAERCMLEHTIVVPTTSHNVQCIHATCLHKDL